MTEKRHSVFKKKTKILNEISLDKSIWEIGCWTDQLNKPNNFV